MMMFGNVHAEWEKYVNYFSRPNVESWERKTYKTWHRALFKSTNGRRFNATNWNDPDIPPHDTNAWFTQWVNFAQSRVSDNKKNLMIRMHWNISRDLLNELPDEKDFKIPTPSALNWKVNGWKSQLYDAMTRRFLTSFHDVVSTMSSWYDLDGLIRVSKFLEHHWQSRGIGKWRDFVSSAASLETIKTTMDNFGLVDDYKNPILTEGRSQMIQTFQECQGENSRITTYEDIERALDGTPWPAKITDVVTYIIRNTKRWDDKVFFPTDVFHLTGSMTTYHPLLTKLPIRVLSAFPDKTDTSRQTGWAFPIDTRLRMQLKSLLGHKFINRRKDVYVCSHPSDLKYYCTACRKAVYCSEQCQEEHWMSGGHSEECA
jgi:hypothetical protein